jgi:hypothetical protein
MVRLVTIALMCAPFAFAVDSDDLIQKSIPLSSATRLILRADMGAVRVEPGNNDSVNLDAYFHGAPWSARDLSEIRRNFSLKVERHGSDIEITGTLRADWSNFFWNWRGRSLEYRITIPQKLSADISTSGGPIWLRDLGGRVEAHTSGGPITVEHNFGRASVHTSGGPITVKNANGPIDATTSGGPITATIVSQPSDECRLVTSGGPISVWLVEKAHVDLAASTTGGAVWTDFPLPATYEGPRSSLHAAINGGGPRLYLHTSGGPIAVHRAESKVY